MSDQTVLFIVLAPLISAMVVAILTYLKDKWRNLKEIIAFLALLTPLGLILRLYFTMGEGPVVYTFGGYDATLGILFVVDKMSLIMAFIVFLATFSGFLYSLSRKYAIRGKSGFYFYYLMMAAGLYGIILTGDLFNLYVFFELTMISSYVLITFSDTERAFRSSFNYLILGTAASMFFLLAIGLIYLYTGQLNIDLIASRFGSIPVEARSLIFVMLLGATGVKSALVPFHLWLPDAHSSAPTPVSAVLSGITVKAGVYITYRLFFISQSVADGLTVILILGCITAIVGAYFALIQHDLKRVLAYHTVSQMGLIFIGIGLANDYSLGGAIYHTLNHATFKALLFLSAGTVIYITGTRDLRDMNPCPPDPILMIGLITGALAISGVPFFNGFISKSLLYHGAHDSIVVMVVIVVTTIGTVASMSKILYYILIKPAKTNRTCTESSVPTAMKLSLLILAPLCIVFGTVAPALLQGMINPAASAVLGSAVDLHVPKETFWMWMKDLAVILGGMALAALVVKKGKIVDKIHSMANADLNRAAAAIILTLALVLFLI